MCAQPADLTLRSLPLFSPRASSLSTHSLPFGGLSCLFSTLPPGPIPASTTLCSPAGSVPPLPPYPGPRPHSPAAPSRASPASAQSRGRMLPAGRAQRSVSPPPRPRARADPPAGNARLPSQDSWAAPGSPARAIRPLRRPRGAEGPACQPGRLSSRLPPHAPGRGRAVGGEGWALGRRSQPQGLRSPFHRPGH